MDRLKFERFIPIAKVDDEERMVYGFASTPDLDTDGEIIKTEALEKALPDYLQFPTIREMHQAKAIGTTKQADISKEGLYIGAKIVSDDAWKLVKEGVYKAFSIGGNVIKRVGNIIQELDLIEISLVDVPANKAAVIEVWKRGKLSKDAETAYSMANLMIQVKDLIYWYEYKGKDTTKLTECLEMIKEMLVVEAQEPEEADNMNENEDMEPMMMGKHIYDGKTVKELKAKIAVLEKMDFKDNELANAIRKGVILNMAKKAEELEKEEDPKKEEETETEEKTEGSEEASKEESKEEETKEIKEEESSKDSEDEKETGSLDANLKKIQDAGDEVEKGVTEEEKEEKSETLDVTKLTGSIADTFAKFSKAIKALQDEVKELKDQPGATKSKSVLVQKTLAEVDGDQNQEKKIDSDELKAKKARVTELNKMFDDMGANEFAKQGYSKEAGRLLNEIWQLEHPVA